MSSKCKMTASILFQGLQFLCRRELYVSVLSSFKIWTTTNLLPNKLRRFASSYEWRMSLAVLVQGWGQKLGSLLLLSLATDASMVRNVADCFEGKAAQPAGQQAENRSDNCILGNNYSFPEHAFVTRIQIKRPDVLRQGAWMAGHETIA